LRLAGSQDFAGSSTNMTDITARYREIQARIAAAALEAGRDISGITLIAVSKTFAAEAIRPLLGLGHVAFGENRVQEAKAKWPALQKDFPAAQLHLIGPLQSNKAGEAIELFDTIHSLDRESLASTLARELPRLDRRPELFVQVNTGLEPQKSGVAPADTLAFVDRCRDHHKLQIAGLMCIPPEHEEPSVHFALLARLARDCGLARLSMGMSGDFETAISFGATHIRVGSAIFGTRPQH
jgi:PLP dependent protein